MLHTLKDAAEYVHRTLPQCFLESHFARAFALELKARGITLVAEFVAPAMFTDSIGSSHAISNDRIDILITAPLQTIVEIKKCAGTPRQIEDATAQLKRYAINMATVHSTAMPVGFVLVFAPDGPVLRQIEF